MKILKTISASILISVALFTMSPEARPAAPLTSLTKDRPKMRVAVAKFGATDRFASVYGGWNIGGGLSAQLVTELIKTGRVVVVERAILSKVLIEQELGESQLLTPMTKTPAGHLLGVDYLIVGEVTEFEERQIGAGAAAGFLGAKVGGEISAAHVGIDLRLVDTRTGEILYSHQAQGKAWEKAAGAKVDYKLINFGGDAFHKTPLGRACRRAIRDAVNFVLGVIEKQVEDFSWLGLIVEVDREMVYFNAGSGQEIIPGDRFRISTIKKVLTDPETNQVIGLIENKLGLAQAVYVDQKYTKARILGKFRPRVGDIVRFADQRRHERSQHQEDLLGYNIME
jgi:curli biogenesis system outer membrane secretion channel CsgG